MMIDDPESRDMILPQRPEEPDPNECCGRNCERCVYIYYEEALQRWHENVAKLKAK